MSAVRQELLDQIDKLDEKQQQQLLEFVRILAKPQALTWAQWLALADQAQAKLRAKYGEQHYFNSQAVLDEAREERLDDILGRH
jgi:hypothetical protein